MVRRGGGLPPTVRRARGSKEELDFGLETEPTSEFINRNFLLDGALGKGCLTGPVERRPLALAIFDDDRRRETPICPSGGDGPGDGWLHTGSAWNQHAFYGTNIDGELSVPRRPAMPWEVGAGFRSAHPRQ